MPMHSHHNEQITYILEGVLRFWLGEDESQLGRRRGRRGAAHPAALPHTADALEDTLDVDIFRRRARTGSTAATRTCAADQRVAGGCGRVGQIVTERLPGFIRRSAYLEPSEATERKCPCQGQRQRERRGRSSWWRRNNRRLFRTRDRPDRRGAIDADAELDRAA